MPSVSSAQRRWRHIAGALAITAMSLNFEAAMADFQKKTSRPEPPELQVARQEMAGHIEAAEGRTDRALKTLEAASKAERKLVYTEPPFYPRPVAEALGHLASRSQKPEVARKAYAAALAQYPGDAHVRPVVSAAK